MEMIAIIILIGVILYQGVFIFLQKKDYNVKQSEMLNRLMARNYEVYVQGEIETQKKPLTDSEIYAMKQERGIPV